jgi:hypothetical protein
MIPRRYQTPTTGWLPRVNRAAVVSRIELSTYTQGLRLRGAAPVRDRDVVSTAVQPTTPP